MSAWQTGIFYIVTQHAIVDNKQITDKILSKRSNVPIEHVKHWKSQDSFLK